MMAKRFGPRIGPWLILLGRGIGDTDVVTEPREPKGRSKTVTFPTDLVDRRRDRGQDVAAIARDVGDEVVAAGRAVRRVAVTVRTVDVLHPDQDHDAAGADARRRRRSSGRRCTCSPRFPLDRAVRMLSVRVEFRRRERDGRGHAGQLLNAWAWNAQYSSRGRPSCRRSWPSCRPDRRSRRRHR